jgi:hypothetical protein
MGRASRNGLECRFDTAPLVMVPYGETEISDVAHRFMLMRRDLRHLLYQGNNAGLKQRGRVAWRGSKR